MELQDWLKDRLLVGCSPLTVNEKSHVRNLVGYHHSDPSADEGREKTLLTTPDPAGAKMSQSPSRQCYSLFLCVCLGWGNRDSSVMDSLVVGSREAMRHNGQT